jgi:hypothetical protein
MDHTKNCSGRCRSEFTRSNPRGRAQNVRFGSRTRGVWRRPAPGPSRTGPSSRPFGSTSTKYSRKTTVAASLGGAIQDVASGGLKRTGFCSGNSSGPPQPGRGLARSRYAAWPHRRRELESPRASSGGHLSAGKAVLNNSLTDGVKIVPDCKHVKVICWSLVGSPKPTQREEG